MKLDASQLNPATLLVPYASPQTIVPPRAEVRATVLDRLAVIIALGLLALAQVQFAGYRLGVGNQTIQIPFIDRHADPTLYAKDAMVVQTAKDYPSYFFKGLGYALRYAGKHVELPTLYFALHLLTTFLFLASVYALAKAIFRDPLAAFIAVLLVLAGHQRALAGDELYSVGFTHTYAVLPLALFSLALFYRGWGIPAVLLAGLIFNLHALTGAYLLAMYCAWAVLDAPPKSLFRLPLTLLSFALVAAPTGWQMYQNRHQVFSAEWIRLTWVRSADHSLPSSWWQAGTADIPQFVLLLALGALAMSFRMPLSNGKAPTPAHKSWWARIHPATRATWLFALAIFGLFAIGYVFSEFKPHATILRAQLFRSSRLLLVLALVYTAYGIAGGLRALLVRGEAPRWKGTLEALAAVCVFASVALPELDAFLPWSFALALLVALINGRLALWQSIVGAAAAWVVLLAFKKIEFHVPGIGESLLASLPRHLPTASLLFVLALVAGIGLYAVARLRVGPVLKCALALQGVLIAVLLVYSSHRSLAQNALAADGWAAAQLFARTGTPRDALFLTPAMRGGFRMLSQRAVVCEWRDGTQMYFNAAFGADWWRRLSQVQRNIAYNDTGRRRIAAGQSIEGLSDEQILKIADATKATHVVLPTNSAKPRALKCLYRNTEWSVYETVLESSTEMAANPAARRFIDEVFLPNVHGWDDKAEQIGVRFFDRFGQMVYATSPQEAALDDDKLLALTYSKGGYFLVLPASKRERNLRLVHTTRTWHVYEARQVMPRDVVDRDAWIAQEAFIEEVALPNIEKYRKGDASISVVDAAGNEVQGTFAIRQTRQAFKFGASLPVFAEPKLDGKSIKEYEYVPPVVDPRELERFKEIFNYSVIPFSAKWNHIEPEEGRRLYEDLDKYVDWCHKNGIEMELHYLSGFVPAWLRGRSDADVQAAFLRHSMDLLNRYGDRIKVWQLVNDKYLIAYSPAVFNEMRAARSDLRLGISDCTKFAEMARGFRGPGGSRDSRVLEGRSPRAFDMENGLAEVRELRQGGTPADFFAFHGHSPHGVWPSAGKMYEVLDTFAREDVRLHVSEAMLPMRRILGPLRDGAWTEELRAEFLVQFYTILFSHPAVDSINYWNVGPCEREETPGAGLLDANYKPLPPFVALKDLIRRQWRTELAGQLSDSGGVSFRGFHGDYEVEVKTADGKTLRGTFSIQPGAMEKLSVVVK